MKQNWNDEEMLELVKDRGNWRGDLLPEVFRRSIDDGFRDAVIDAVQSAGQDAATLFMMARDAAGKAEQEAQRTTTENGIIKPVKKVTSLYPISAAELDALEIPPLRYLVSIILHPGLFMIGAPSKYYKSFMAIQLCLAICTGMPFFGYETHKAACLYFDLESTKRRPRDRVNMILGRGNKKPDNFYIITADDRPARIGDGFRDQVEEILLGHPDIRLIVIDVFQKIRPPAKRTQSGYDRDYEDLTELKEIADSHDLCVLLIHHTRKLKDPSDVYNDLSGSSAIMGALDGAWLISKEKRESTEGTLHITGRDIESQELSIKFDKSRMIWECLGTAEEVENRRMADEYSNSPVIATIKKLMKRSGGSWTGTAQDIAAASHYIGTHITGDVREIGKDINRFEMMLEFDGISFEFNRTGHKGERTYVFTSATSVTSATS